MGASVKDGEGVGIESCSVVGATEPKGERVGWTEKVGRGTRVMIVEREGKEVGYDEGREVGKVLVPGGQIDFGQESSQQQQRQRWRRQWHFSFVGQGKGSDVGRERDGTVGLGVGWGEIVGRGTRVKIEARVGEEVGTEVGIEVGKSVSTVGVLV